MTTVELTGDDWRRIGGPIDERAEEALRSLVPDVAVPDPLGAARRIGADHLPLAALVAVLARARRARDADVDALLGTTPSTTPFLVGVTGGVAVGKSMAAQALATLLVEQLELDASVVATDGFLFPNATLEARGLMSRKGFPESYDQAALLQLLEGLGAGRDDLVVPRYDHLASDVLDGPGDAIGRPDVLVLEGLNVLQPSPDPTVPASVADHLHLAVYVDADPSSMHAWYTARLLDLRSRPAGEVPSYFAGVTGMPDEEFVALTDLVWDHVNRPNLDDHIEPTRALADVVLEKGADHRVGRVVLRR